MLELLQGDTNMLIGRVNNNLTGATGTLHVKRPTGVTFTKAAALIDPLHGEWSVQWSAGDLATVGLHTVWLSVVYSDGATQTFGLFRRQKVRFKVRVPGV